MIADGVLETYRPARCYGIHLWSELQTGELVVRERALFASCDKVSESSPPHSGAVLV